MSEKAKPTDADVQFPLNKKLLEESTKIMEERGVMKERIKKIESSREKVSPSVYERVRGDYLEQLEKNTNELLEKKQDIDKELGTLTEAKKKVTENVNTHKEKLEEINFRYNLGEFKEDEFHKLATEENEKLGKFEKILAAITSNIEKYESLFADEEEIFGEPSEFEQELPPPSEDTSLEGPLNMEPSEEEYEVGASQDYFGAVTEEVPAQLEEEPHESTDKVVAPAKEKEGVPTIEVIEGDNAGEIHKVVDSEITIGRASSNHIVLREAKVSRQHASIKRQGSEYLLEDLHSSNGVFVNDEKIKEHVLADGDIIKIGDFAMRFKL